MPVQVLSPDWPSSQDQHNWYAALPPYCPRHWEPIDQGCQGCEADDAPVKSALSCWYILTGVR